MRNTKTGEMVHEGVDRDQLEPLIQELLDYVNNEDVESVFLRAAMTHLNLALLHPLRTARCIHATVLASARMRAGRLLSPL